MTEPRVLDVTPSERAVIGELARDGACNKDIAARLNITDHTVRSHLKATMKRSGHPTRTALVVDLLRGQLKLRVVTYGRGPSRTTRVGA